MKIHYLNAEHHDLVSRHGLDDPDALFGAAEKDAALPARYSLIFTRDLSGLGTVFIKLYRRCAGHFPGRRAGSIARRELRNSLRMASLGIPQPETLCVATAAGPNRSRWDSCIITRAVENARSLEQVLEHMAHSPDDELLARITRQVIDVTRRMHAGGFCHWDLKPRNILVVPADGRPQIYLIDSRNGRAMGFWNRRHCIRRDYRFLPQYPLLAPHVRRLLDDTPIP